MQEFALAAIRALRDAKLDVPEDVSVIGFDDIQLATYQIPRLMTIRQPLRNMGETAARILLQRLHGFRDYSIEFAVPPKLIIPGITAAANPKRRL
jgi:LacI family transcriptional regulator